MIDSIISTISPKWGLEREKYRRAHKILASRKYDGAAKGRRTDGWMSTGNDANLEIYSGLVTLRNRSRELIRNNSYALSAQSVVVTNVIGDGIVGQVNATDNKEALSLTKLFNNWCGSTSADAEGKFNFYGLQALIEGSRFESGEVIIRRIYPKSGEYKYVPFKIQVLEADFLDVDKSEDLANGGRIIQGIEVDKAGKTVGYWLFNNHPGSGKAYKSSKVPASDVIHYLRRKRPGQMRSVPDLTPVMITLNDLDGYQDAQLLKQKISACFTAFVIKPAGGFSENPTTSAISEKMEPGAIDELNDGEDIKFATPPTSGDYDSFSKSNLRKVATGLGITYEALTADYSESNFSQSRMAERVFNKNVHAWRWNYFIPIVLDRVWEWFNEAALVEGATKNIYQATWTPPKRELLNPKEDNEADITSIRGCLTSWSRVIRSRGDDPDEVANEMAADNARFDRLGIISDADPRKVMKAGSMQQPTAMELTNDKTK